MDLMQFRCERPNVKNNKKGAPRRRNYPIFGITHRRPNKGHIPTQDLPRQEPEHIALIFRFRERIAKKDLEEDGACKRWIVVGRIGYLT